MGEQGPLAPGEAWRAVAACFLTTFALLSRHRIRLPKERVGVRLDFADGTGARVYRETRLGSGLAKDPCTLVVVFRLRLVRGPAHALFRRESLLNTPLFVGFPGFTSKLWLAHDERGRYRGVYEWDGPRRAEHYARSLWRVLALVSEPGSIRYAIVPGLRRDAVIADPPPAGGPEPEAAAWWRTAART
ncbi:hypothetical protein H114_07466 [Streptomyces gancidicus BKS 13-15]|uniref:Uncharacterized protein n=1 Tax=Streptomyces gancidicus BKS 13-15 TaxID=1284664 RepID=M3D017_STREZ|nr:hypothetical protein [Streptomyces gancidicus]EMF29713.1 hypothetical protein H114_07466 [Streptomyces gancidicus BKS 13-15]